MDIKVHAKFVKGSSQKAGRVIGLVRGKGVEQSLNILRFVPASASTSVYKLISSAVARALQLNLSPVNLYIKEVFVTQGPTMKRSRAGSRGTAKPIKRKTFHLTVVVGEKGGK